MKLSFYTIRFCKKDEYNKLVDFIHDYWDENHVFCRNKDIFEFQHGDACEGEYDFIIAVHNETNEIHAVLGFISSSRYDEGDIKNPVFVAGALWKVRDDIHNNEIGKLGLDVLYYLLKKFPDSAYITLGLSKYSQDIYNALHFDFGIMNHYYIASSELAEFKIAENPVVCVNIQCNTEYELAEVDEVPVGFDTYYYPTKNANYIKNRYINHPFYKYKLLGVFGANDLLSIWVTREIEIEGSKCIRIVDIVGDIGKIGNIGGNIHKYLKACKAEFVDCYNYGIYESIFMTIGFRKVEGDTIIPNYYEPFERRNVDIHYAACSKQPVVIFKGDCDQDRPNLLEIK